MNRSCTTKAQNCMNNQHASSPAMAGQAIRSNFVRVKMYKIVLIFFLVQLLLPSIVTGQAYKSIFGNDTTQWNIKHEFPDYLQSIIYKSFGDTTINAKFYKPVYEYDLPKIKKVGYLREDTTIGKLWFLFPDGEEKMIMDLTLNKNDTFYSNKTHWSIVDTVFFYEGNKNIVFDEPINFGDTVKFIESIGPNNLFNFLEYFHIYPENAVILCSYKDNIQVYKNNNFQGCFLEWTSIVEINKSNEFVIYPNPCSDILTVKFNNPNKGSNIKIFSCDGKVVIQSNKIQEFNVFDITGLRAGIYFVHFTYNKVNSVRSVIIH
jgi:hypothetical protein